MGAEEAVHHEQDGGKMKAWPKNHSSLGAKLENPQDS